MRQNYPYLLAVLALLAPGSPASAAETYTVQISDFAFKPASLTVSPGDTVVFINRDGDAHTVSASDKSFDSAGLDTNEKWTHTFTKPGTYAYFCELHPYMKGVIVVRGGAGGAR
jgi:plastocyanin